MCLFKILVGCCRKKVVRLAERALCEFREGTQPPCSGAQTRLARQGYSTHVHAQMNARWEVGWGQGVGVVASIVPTGSLCSIQDPAFALTRSLALFFLNNQLLKRQLIVFLFF